MKLWLLSQEDNTGWDTFNSCVVAAETEDDAKKIDPQGNVFPSWGLFKSWADSPDSVQAECIGEATPGTVRSIILASFNAG